MFIEKIVDNIQSSFKGTVMKVYYKQDDVIQVGSTIMDIDVPDANAVGEKPPSRPSGQKALASPSAWHLA